MSHTPSSELPLRILFDQGSSSGMILLLNGMIWTSRLTQRSWRSSRTLQLCLPRKATLLTCSRLGPRDAEHGLKLKRSSCRSSKGCLKLTSEKSGSWSSKMNWFSRSLRLLLQRRPKLFSTRCLMPGSSYKMNLVRSFRVQHSRNSRWYELCSSLINWVYSEFLIILFVFLSIYISD